MAKKNEPVSTKQLNKFLNDYLFQEPERQEDGTIKTGRYKTGIVMLDLLLNGGLPKGRIVSLGAEWGVGKTTMLIQTCGNIAEAYDKKIYYLDVEGGATYELWEAMGYAHLLYHPKDNPEGNVYLLSIETIQQVSAISKKVLEDPDTAVIVIDSTTQTTDQLAIDDEFLGTGKNDVGLNARMWSKVSKPLMSIVKHSEACMVLINQARTNLSNFHPVIEAAGGNALKHMPSVEIWGKKKAWIDKNFVFTKFKEEAIGAYVKLTTKKNRLTKPFAVVEVPILFGLGVSNKWAYKDWLTKNTTVNKATGELVDVLKKAGAGYYTLTLPSGEYKARGDIDMWNMVDDHIEEIQSYVEEHGGFKLDNFIKGDEE